jgi:putative hydrolase of the HAD superfamily
MRPRPAVLFDFGGTLDADGLRWSVRFHAAYRRHGGRLDGDEFEPIFRASDRALETLPGICDLGFRAMIAAQAVLLRGLLPDGATVDAAQVAEIIVGDSLEAIDRNRPLLRSLRQHYRLGLVSNFCGNLGVCLDELALTPMFDAIVDSAVIGAAKPDPRPFQHALSALETRPDEAWMVGDNPDADIRGAQRLGIRTVWLAPESRLTPPDCTPTRRIASLLDLPGALTASATPSASPTVGSPSPSPVTSPCTR